MDLTQEILLKVARNISSLKNPKCFKGWLNHIVSNAFYDEKRKEKRHPETIPVDFTCPNINLGIQIEFKENRPVEKCINSECERQIKTAIRGLPETFRLAIILREFQGLSYEQIANTTNSSIGTVKSRISRARMKLQEVLKNYL
jgi:RNA polymerase sigma-70 factor (ECF subfamily)